MDKFIGFDIDHKHRVACVVQAGQPDRYRTLRTDVGELRAWLTTQRGVIGMMDVAVDAPKFGRNQAKARSGATGRR